MTKYFSIVCYHDLMCHLALECLESEEEEEEEEEERNVLWIDSIDASSHPSLLRR